MLFPGDLLAFLEASELLVLAQVEPEFEQYDPVVAKLFLEIADLLVGPLPFVVACELLYSLHQHPPIPGAIINCEVTCPRDVSLESPQIVVSFFLIGRCCHRDDALESCVDRTGYPPNRSTFTRRVPAFHYGDGEPLFRSSSPCQLADLVLIFSQKPSVGLV